MSESVSLAEVLRGVATMSVARGLPTDLVITGLADDSRSVTRGALFFAVPGTKVDGSQFAVDAVKRGAVAVVGTNALLNVAEQRDTAVICVEDVRAALATCAANFYRHPTRELQVFGVTGTNGKTSSCWLLTELLAILGKPCAQLGTLGTRFCKGGVGESRHFEATGTTTPGPILLQSILATVLTQGAQAAAFEVSSHAMEQRRADCIEWDCALFTNLTHDHLDYHGTFENYYLAKERLFTELLAASSKSKRVAVVNIDDTYGKRLAARLKSAPQVKCVTWSCAGKDAHAILRDVSYSPQGTSISLRVFGEVVTMETQLIGGFNVSNISGVVLALVTSGFSLADVAQALPRVPPVPGRLELVAPRSVSVFIDYAHTPDGLVCAQEALRVAAPGQRLITVFGCGGSRDRGKRPVMGRAVAERSDFAIVTSDNPREEDPQAIIQDIIPGLTVVSAGDSIEFEVEADRRTAIRRAIEIADPGDLVLVAGKGHEDYQEIQGKRFPFSDREQCLIALNELGLD